MYIHPSHFTGNTAQNRDFPKNIFSAFFFPSLLFKKEAGGTAPRISPDALCIALRGVAEPQDFFFLPPKIIFLRPS